VTLLVDLGISEADLADGNEVLKLREVLSVKAFTVDVDVEVN
jgi:hypothetical protein